MKISIAMATYNGERYLQEQLDSLVRQKLLPHELVVCDDGSTDSTPRILEEFVAEAPFPVRFYRNDKTLGFAENFLKAAHLCRGDWIALCDQDDVWLPNKLSDCANVIALHPHVHMVLQNAWLCDSDLHPGGRLFPNSCRPGLHGSNERPGFWHWFGFLQTFSSIILDEYNSAARPIDSSSANKAQTHDKWLAMIANALGGYIVIKRAAALYRRHETAVTGFHSKRSFRETLRTALETGETVYSLRADAAESAASYLKEMARQIASNTSQRSSRFQPTCSGGYRTFNVCELACMREFHLRKYSATSQLCVEPGHTAVTGFFPAG